MGNILLLNELRCYQSHANVELSMKKGMETMNVMTLRFVMMSLYHQCRLIDAILARKHSCFKDMWLRMKFDKKICKKCTDLTNAYLQENPSKRGHCLCEECYEKSKEYVVYIDMPYDPYEMSNSNKGAPNFRGLLNTLLKRNK